MYVLISVVHNIIGCTSFIADSGYRGLLSTAVLRLQESGRLAQLKNKWWKEKRGGGKCSVSELNKILYNIMKK